MVSTKTDSDYQTGGKLYRHLLDHAPICIFVADLTRTSATILEANRRAELVYGYQATELIGLPATDLMPEDAKPAGLSILRRVQQGEIVKVETSHRRRDGMRFPVRFIAALDPTDAGQMIITVEDITAERQRRSEAEAIARERLRIAQEIHDGVAQNLAGLRFKSALWSHLAEAAPPGMRGALDELQGVLIATIADIRRVIFALRPLDLEALGFSQALRQLVADFGEQNQLVTHFEVSGLDDSLPIAYELPIFRIIQEGLNNISQHARASSVQVCLALDEAGDIAISLCDNGRGFEPSQLAPADPPGHFGLRQMRERILSLEGTLDIHSAPGQGTELRITLPPTATDLNHAAE